MTDAEVTALVRRDRLADLRKRRRWVRISVTVLSAFGFSLCMAATAVSPIYFFHVLVCIAGIRWHQKLGHEVNAEISELSGAPRALLVTREAALFGRLCDRHPAGVSCSACGTRFQPSGPSRS